ncbi:MATE family efflux transporter [Pseudodonghicola flavimaris]|uniref:MATE family efflux transporter n=1 Tax=Pseudodonghicola flavimaris TaxID=3050036 RepID=A0ABT7EXT7_9RHOB|nr:MATE family efflux transporter [Pseudodonghicola flavimaris]MDK3017161.1 MATE family efflux transporter [Pseudodonghicola flavimaris]
MAQRGRFLTGSTMGHVMRMTLTGATGITFIFLVDAANLFWLSQLGDPRLMAAVGFAFAVQFFSVSMGIGLMIGGTALVARGIGAGRFARARRQATAAALLAGGIMALVALLIVVFRHELVALAGAEGETAALAARYLAMSIPSLPLMAVGMIANASLRAFGDGRRSMFVTLFPGLVTMVVDPLMIYGLGMGLDGAALGVDLSRLVMLSVALRFAVGTHDLLARPRRIDLRLAVRPYLAIALPAILTQMATPAGNYALTRVMAPFGDDAMAGWAVVGRLTVVAFGGIFSLSGAIGGIFGQNFGAREYARLRSTYRDALIFALIYTLVAWGLLAATGGMVARGFALGAEGAAVVRAFTTLGAGGFLFAAALFVSNAAFNAMGRPVRSTLSNWLRDGLLTLPLGLALAAGFGAAGVIYAQAMASALVGCLACWWGWRFVLRLDRAALPGR